MFSVISCAANFMTADSSVMWYLIHQTTWHHIPDGDSYITIWGFLMQGHYFFLEKLLVTCSAPPTCQVCSSIGMFHLSVSAQFLFWLLRYKHWKCPKIWTVVCYSGVPLMSASTFSITCIMQPYIFVKQKPMFREEFQSSCFFRIMFLQWVLTVFA
jgi:hypothetical protein